MITLNCPSCGANVVFKSKSSIFAVCPYCRSTLIRQDMKLEDVGTMAQLQDELTPLQIGTTGYFGGQKFEIIGRLKVGYDQGCWNEWYLLFSGEKEGWLAEAQGFYAVCLPCAGESVPDRGQLKPGRIVTFGSRGEFQVEDMRSVSCWYSEGELPVNAVLGRRSFSVDLTGPDCQMATIEYADNETRVYAGDYQEFDDFKFANLRHLDGW